MATADEVARWLLNTHPAYADAIRRGLALGAIIIQNDAKRIVPVDTGNLQRSIVAANLDDYVWSIGSDEAYAARIEYGYVGQVDALGRQFSGPPPQPYLAPAAINNQDRISTLINGLMDRAVP